MEWSGVEWRRVGKGGVRRREGKRGESNKSQRDDKSVRDPLFFLLFFFKCRLPLL